MTGQTTILHAGCVLVGEAGILITGASGAGKSSLARQLIEAARRRGTYAALVSDDRTILSREAGRLIARPHPLIAGRLEVRGLGLVEETGATAAVVRLLVELDASAPPRLPEQQERVAMVLGLAIPRFQLDSRKEAGENAALVQFRLDRGEQN